MGAQRQGLGAQAAERGAVDLDRGVELAELFVELRDALLEGVCEVVVVGRDLEQPGPAERIGPRGADGAIAFVAWARWRSLAAEAVACIEPPQASVVRYPWRVVVDQNRGPFMVVPGADDDAVAPGVVDEWNT